MAMDAAIYCRLSHVNDASTIGVDRQEADGRAVVAARKWNLAAVHVDNNRSAWRRNRKRPGWDQLLNDIREHRVDVVVVAHPDRLIRQPRDLEDLLDLARDTGVQLVSAGGNRDLSNPDDVFILRIEVAHACRSSDDTSRRVARGHLAAVTAGRPGGGTGRYRAYGYDSDQMTIRPDEHATVTEAARRALEGESLGSIARDLNRRQVPTVSGTPWTRTVLSGVLRSPRTAALREHKGTVAGPAVWPALLDRDTWEAVRSTITHPSMPVGNNRRRYLLSGLVRCSHCDVSMDSRTGNPPGYACRTCSARVARPHLDAYVITELVHRLDDPELRARLADEAPDNSADEKIIEEGSRRIARILDEWEASDDDMTKQWAQRKVAEVKADMDRARSRIANRVRRSGLADLPPMSAETFRLLPLAVQRTIVTELLPDLSVSRATRRGRGFDQERVSFDRT